ncbi:MAG: C-factor [Rhodospirillaceae bacterium]|nr:C-factor [Rhodospirillaceae bacterium]
MLNNLNFLPENSSAIVMGANGGIGKAILKTIKSKYKFKNVFGLSRKSEIYINYYSEESIKKAAEYFLSESLNIRLIINCAGYLYDKEFLPEKSIKDIDINYMQKSFYMNSIGPALFMKYFFPVLPRDNKFIFANLSAKVGSISDNKLGGWLSYRSSKAALNQLVKCMSIELYRRNKNSICVAIHPGTVDTNLSKPFNKKGLNVRTPDVAANEILSVISSLNTTHNGKFLDYKFKEITF